MRNMGFATSPQSHLFCLILIGNAPDATNHGSLQPIPFHHLTPSPSSPMARHHWRAAHHQSKHISTIFISITRRVLCSPPPSCPCPVAALWDHYTRSTASPHIKMPRQPLNTHLLYRTRPFVYESFARLTAQAEPKGGTPPVADNLSTTPNT
jgi:hypothetical protein